MKVIEGSTRNAKITESSNWNDEYTIATGGKGIITCIILQRAEELGINGGTIISIHYSSIYYWFLQYDR